MLSQEAVAAGGLALSVLGPNRGMLLQQQAASGILQLMAPWFQHWKTVSLLLCCIVCSSCGAAVADPMTAILQIGVLEQQARCHHHQQQQQLLLLASRLLMALPGRA
jgi:hypothetical protein